MDTDIREKALFAASFLDSRKAMDITVIDISEKSGFADCFVIASAASLRQLEALSSDLDDKMAERGWISGHTEGKGDSGWILIDFGDVIVNLFTIEQREHYNLEKLWGDCVRVDFEPAKEQA
ncbi:MAG: ribosome silencing factor [Firmicutes bacterium]|nr:ribosome silencing factor [Bacillota bacterium]MBQ2058978.1 ribosome silencing factor [Bacillota bacterium]MBQ4371601.1 ribosome silencing factor [Bacillota bacterium]